MHPFRFSQLSDAFGSCGPECIWRDWPYRGTAISLVIGVESLAVDQLLLTWGQHYGMGTQS